MRVAIVGCGYVGRHVASLLRSRGYTLSATTTSSAKVAELQTFVDEVYPFEELSQALQGADFALFAVSTDHLEVAKKLMKALPASTHLLYTGTTSVYGEANGAVVDENSPLSPGPLTETEQIIRSHSPSLIFRLGQIVGPGREPERRLKGGAPFPGTGENPINISPLELIVKGIALGIEKRLTGIYNLVDDIHITRKEYYEQLAKEHGLPPPSWDPEKRSPHGGSKIVSNQKFKATLKALF